MNAKKEFERHTKNLPKIICASMCFDESKRFYLIEGHSEKELEGFLESIDINYHEGFKYRQKLEGLIWYEGGSWSERGEYDGSEWWEYKRTPEIPQALKKASKV